MARGSNEVGQNDELDIDSLEVRPEEVYNPDELRRLFAAQTQALTAPSLPYLP